MKIEEKTKAERGDDGNAKKGGSDKPGVRDGKAELYTPSKKKKETDVEMMITSGWKSFPER
jgi:hypothetical protein